MAIHYTHSQCLAAEKRIDALRARTVQLFDDFANVIIAGRNTKRVACEANVLKSLSELQSVVQAAKYNISASQ